MRGFRRIAIALQIFATCGYTINAQGVWWNDWWDHRHHTPNYRGCDMKIVHNNTILFNPNYPQTFAGGSRCSYQIHPSHHVCQLRIDFLVFSLAQPNGDGECVTDYFTVESGSSFVPRICGENTGSHVYVTTSGKFPVSIVVATTATNTFNRRWQLRVSQVKCLSPFRAPPNCLQYHLEQNGFIRSFNYGRDENGNFNSIGVTGSRQIAGLDYNICIRRQAGMCFVTYTRPISDPLAFTLTNDVKSVDPSVLGAAVLLSQTCTTDYLVIPSISQVINGVRVPLTSDRLCGMGIGEIISQSLPFNVRAVTDPNETPDIANRGFYLNYRQGSCLI